MASSNAHARVKGLKCYEEVLKRLQAGDSFGKVAKFVQEEQGEMMELDPRSAEMALRRFGDAYPGLVLTQDPVLARSIEIMHGKTPRYIEKWQEILEDRLDALWEMENLYRAQLRRVARLMESEEQKALDGENDFIPELRFEMKQAFSMAKDVLNAQMDLGYRQRVPADFRVYKEEKKLDYTQLALEMMKNSPGETRETVEAKLKELARLELLEGRDMESLVDKEDWED